MKDLFNKYAEEIEQVVVVFVAFLTMMFVLQFIFYVFNGH